MGAGRGREDAGGGAALGPRPPEGRSRAARAPLLRLPPRPLRGAGSRPCPPASPEQTPSWGGGAQGAASHPSLWGSDSRVVRLYCRGLGQVAAAPLGFFKDGESDAESLQVTEESAERDTGLSGREVSFLGWELEFPRITGGLRRETCCLALPEVPSRLQRPGSLPRPRCRDGNSQGGNRLFPRSVLSCLLSKCSLIINSGRVQSRFALMQILRGIFDNVLKLL